MKNYLIKIVNELIKKEARKEALDILELTTEDFRNQFINYYEDDKDNICCMVLDAAKIKLVEGGKMEMSDKDYFGYKF